jgi:hypothetical protein
MGCILYELVSGEKLFKSDGAVSDYARQQRYDGQILDVSRVTSPTWLDAKRKVFISRLILEMLEVTPAERPDAEQIYKRFTGWGAGQSSRPLRSSRSVTTSVSVDIPHPNEVNPSGSPNSRPRDNMEIGLEVVGHAQPSLSTSPIDSLPSPLLRTPDYHGNGANEQLENGGQP